MCSLSGPLPGLCMDGRQLRNHPGSLSYRACIVLYAFLNAHREDVGRIPEPVDNRPGESTAPAPAPT